ncbi:MAG: putative MATE family efflux protein [Crocinitomicaceae bacterium]|jgi:MATE family multidrug resistance protein
MLDLRYKTILSVAVPLMASSFIQSIVMITDSAFLSRYSTIAFDASGNGGLIYITMFVALMGIADGAQILMARRIGEKKENLLAQIFGTTIFTNVLIAIILCLFIQLLIPNIIETITRNKAIAAGETTFVQIRSYGLFFSAITLTINAYFLAMGRTYVVLLSAIVIAFSNIGLDYALIFGNWGLPRMGLEGAAVASMIADGTGMLFLITALYLSANRKRHELFTKLKYNYESFKMLIKIGAPIAFQGLIALITWTAFFVWIEHKGMYELTLSQNIRALYFLAFIPIWGFAGTTKTYISQYIGSQSFKEIKIVQRRIQLLTALFLVAIFHGAVLYPEALVKMINPEAAYLKGSAEILRFVSGSVLIYGLSSVYFQTINGSGNTKFTLYIETIAVGFYLGFAYLFIKVFNWDIYWIWSVEYIYFSIMGILSIGYLRFFNWQKKTI